MIFVLTNIQSLKGKHVIEIDEKGLYCFTGENSNGKSILGKVLSDIVKCSVVDESIRLPLINDECEDASVMINRGNLTLAVKLSRDLSQCYYALIRDNDVNNKILRYFREGGLSELVEEFGFLVYDGQLCLQIYETFGLLPFVNTSDRMNGACVKSVVTDTVAESFLNNFKDVTYKKGKDKAKQLESRISAIESTLSVMVHYDYRAYAEMYNKMKKLYDNLKFLKPFKLEKIQVIPDVTVINLPNINLRKMPRVQVYKEFKLNKIGKELSDYVDILNGVCPTCGKPIID